MRRAEVSKDDLVGLIESIPDSATITVVEGAGVGPFDFGSFLVGWIVGMVTVLAFAGVIG